MLPKWPDIARAETIKTESRYAVGYSFTLGVVGVEGGTVRRPQKGRRGEGERGRGGEGRRCVHV